MVGEEKMGLGAGECGAEFAWTAICGGENGSSGEGGDETELGAGAGEEWSGVQRFGVGGRCGVSGKGGESTGVGDSAVVGLGSGRIRRGGVCGGGDRCRSSSSTPLSSSTSQRLFAAFLIRFAGGGEGGGEVSCGDGGGGSAGGGSGRV